MCSSEEKKRPAVTAIVGVRVAVTVTTMHGEGSDAVGSDVDVRSEVGEGSDVASIGEGEGYGSDSEDEEDCIEGRWGGYYRSYGRR